MGFGFFANENLLARGSLHPLIRVLLGALAVVFLANTAISSGSDLPHKKFELIYTAYGINSAEEFHSRTPEGACDQL